MKQVIQVSSNHIIVMDTLNNFFECLLKGKLKLTYKNNSNLIKVGDYVEIIQDHDIYFIDKIYQRKNVLSRCLSSAKHEEQVLASNIDQIIMVNAFVEPALKTGLIDRYTVLAERNKLPLIICVNKADLVDTELFDEILDVYRDLKYQIVLTSTETKKGIKELKEILHGKTSVLSGHSGVGKSSLINALQPDLDLKTLDVSNYNQKGVHTTSTGRLYHLDFEAKIIDTPGIREFTLFQIELEFLNKFFIELGQYSNKCKYYNCTHRHEPQCAVKDALEDDKIALFRYESYLYLYDEMEKEAKNKYK